MTGVDDLLKDSTTTYKSFTESMFDSSAYKNAIKLNDDVISDATKSFTTSIADTYAKLGNTHTLFGVFLFCILCDVQNCIN